MASIGPSLDDRRAILTSGVLEFMEELESKDTCLGAKTKLLSFLKNAAMAGRRAGGRAGRKKAG